LGPLGRWARRISSILGVRFFCEMLCSGLCVHSSLTKTILSLLSSSYPCLPRYCRGVVARKTVL
jgi:hypothetical protein